jgi:hypothetical protein
MGRPEAIIALAPNLASTNPGLFAANVYVPGAAEEMQYNPSPFDFAIDRARRAAELGAMNANADDSKLASGKSSGSKLTEACGTSWPESAFRMCPESAHPSLSSDAVAYPMIATVNIAK